MNNREKEPFLPPQLNPILARLCQSLSYLVAGIGYQMHLRVEDADIEKIKALGDARIVYLPNHPTLDDGIALFMFSARSGHLCHYLVARDSFKGWLAHFLPAIGCYSMRRGIGDRNSIAQTVQLLQQGAIRLVIFPEGGCSYQNDTVIPFRSGAVAMALQAMNKLARQHRGIPPLYLVPLSLKYRYTDPMDSQINQTLSRLEVALNIQHKAKADDRYQRLRNIGGQVLQERENKYGIKCENANGDRDWNERINWLKTNLIEQCETKLNIVANAELPIRERVYKIQAALESQWQREGDYNQEIEKFVQETTFELLNFDAIYDGYVAENPNPERFLDTLNRLERSVFKLDKPSPKGARQAIIKVGEPINLQDHYKSYQENKTATVEKLTQILQQSVQDNLNSIVFSQDRGMPCLYGSS